MVGKADREVPQVPAAQEGRVAKALRAQEHAGALMQVLPAPKDRRDGPDQRDPAASAAK
jgi:hypothetical protein